MKLVELFRTFLADTVNLNPTRITLLDDSVEAVEKWVRNSDWGPTIIEFLPQGSWAHETIIKPIDGKAFDADLVIFVKPKEGWDAKQYINELYNVLVAEKSPYKDKARRWSHCVTIEYAGERKIDLTPCVRDRKWSGSGDEVCNRDTNEFETSKPKEYTDWVVERNSMAGSNSFRKATRLLKYLRDIKTTFTCPSFLLTTLIGSQVYQGDKDTKLFEDPATALKTLMGRLDDWLQARPSLPEVRNPVMWTEVQSAVWDDTKYQNFRDRINLYRGWIDEAYDEQDRSESIGKWRRLFGDEFADGEAVEKAERINEVALASYGTTDLVDVLKSRGAIAIPPDYLKLPHISRPKWRTAGDIRLTPVIVATLTSSNKSPLHPVASLQPLSRGYGINFQALQSNGLQLPSDYYVQWRVTNTGKMARAERALRGDFYRSDSGNQRHEGLSYRGLHMVEAFVIRRRDERLVGRSAPHYVLIE